MWDYIYPVVFVPKYRRKAMFEKLQVFSGPVFHKLANQKDCQIVEGHLTPDHIHYVHRNVSKASSGIGDWVHKSAATQSTQMNSIDLSRIFATCGRIAQRLQCSCAQQYLNCEFSPSSQVM